MGNAWRVLIVEDNDDNYKVFKEALEYHNPAVEVRWVVSGEDGDIVLTEFTPDLVILDLELPGKDGWQILGEMRENPALAGVPVVATTAYHSVQVAAKAREVGFDGYFPKPIDVFSFGEQIEAIMRGG
jgi:two-component system cell cycle response regulator DivK